MQDFMRLLPDLLPATETPRRRPRDAADGKPVAARCLSSVADQIRSNANFLKNTYGTPYFRPPYGAHNADTDLVAADQGYTTITL
jgi:peptidoglycan/xylan/chitin deacetylase (PgdA/CDA1 family)